MIQEPILMHCQSERFNEDSFIAEKILELQKEYNIKHAIELGTCLGYSAEWFCQNFEKVDTVEINETYLEMATANRLSKYSNCKAYLGSSVDVLPNILAGIDKNNTVLIFVDSHWGSNWPILEELAIIKNAGIKPVIVIHDFFTPEHSDVLGYDSFENVPLCFEYIEEGIKAIYDSNFIVQYNTPETAAGAMRGVAYIMPLIEERKIKQVVEVKEETPVEEPKDIDFWATKKVGDVIELKTGERLEIIELYQFQVVNGKTDCMVRYKDVTGNERDIKSTLINI